MRSVAQSLLVVAGLVGYGHVVHAQPLPQPQSQSVTLEARAQEHYQLGRDHYRSGEFASARDAFVTSLQMVDSPNTRMYLGRTLRQLGRLAEAYAVLDRAAIDAAERARIEPRYEATRDSARAEADSLSAMVARLRVRVLGDSTGARVTVNGEDLAAGVWGSALPMDPGVVRVVVSAEGVESQTREVELSAGQLHEVSFTVERPEGISPGDAGSAADAAVPTGRDAGVTDAGAETESGGGPWRTTGVVAMLAGGATVGGALAFGLLALNGYNLLEGLDQSGRNDPRNPLIAQGETYQNAANVMFAIGGTMFATGLTFWLAGRFGWPERSGSTPLVTLDPRGFVGAAGTF